MKNKDLKKRIIDISYQKKLAHIGSCLTAVDIIDEIFTEKMSNEKFVLSNGHAGLALYVVLEKHRRLSDWSGLEDIGPFNSADKIYDHHGVHPDRCHDCGIDCSTGSLGQGLPIAVGMAVADRTKNVYCLTSDGEWAEGSMWEALRVKQELKLTNLKLYINFNGWGAYREINKMTFIKHFLGFTDKDSSIYFRETHVNEFPFLVGQIGHYKILTDENYEVALKALE